RILYQEAREGKGESHGSNREAVHHFFRHDFPNFPYNEKADIDSEFGSLRVFMNWPSKEEISRPKKTKTVEQRAREKIFQGALLLFTIAKAKKSPMSNSKKTEERMIRFFATMFPGFDYNPKNGHASEFKRACRSKKWMGPNAENPMSMKSVHKEFRKAQILAFGELFGKSDMKRENWVCLFRALGIEDVPQNIVDCKEVSSLCLFQLHLPSLSACLTEN